MAKAEMDTRDGHSGAANRKRSKAGPYELESLKDQGQESLDEARMVLPGIQAVFGFQLIAIFSERFEHLDFPLQATHFASLCLLVVAIVLIMTPAAYDRIAEPDRITAKFLRRTNRLLTVAMAFFGCALTFELYVIAILATGTMAVALICCAAALVLLTVLWFLAPWRAREGSGQKRRPADALAD